MPVKSIFVPGPGYQRSFELEPWFVRVHGAQHVSRIGRDPPGLVRHSKAALSSAQGHPGFNFAKFADLLLLISFGLAMETYYSTPIPGFGNSFSDLITKEAQFLSNQIESNQADQISNAITTAEEQLGSPPGIFSFHEALTFFAVYISLAIAQGVAFAVIAYGLVATAVCVLLGSDLCAVFDRPQARLALLGMVQGLLRFCFLSGGGRGFPIHLRQGASWGCLASSAHCRFQTPT